MVVLAFAWNFQDKKYKKYKFLEKYKKYIHKPDTKLFSSYCSKDELMLTMN